MLIARRRDQSRYPQAWDELAAAWYPGAGPSGTRLYDLSGRDNHCVLTNGPTWVDGLGGKAISYDGVNDYGTCGSSPNLNFERTDKFSGSTWVNHGVINADDVLFSRRQVSDDRGYVFYITSGNRIELVLQSSNGNRIRRAGSTNILANIWYHVAFSYDGTSLASGVRLYVNGVRETETSPQDNLTTTMQATGQFELGNQTINPLLLTGQLADTLIHSRVLPADEFKLLAQRPGIAFEPKPRVFYSIPASVKAWLFRRQSQIIGGGLG